MFPSIWVTVALGLDPRCHKLRAIKCCSVVFGVTCRLLVINTSSPVNNKRHCLPATSVSMQQLAQLCVLHLAVEPLTQSMKPDIDREWRVLRTPHACNAPVGGGGFLSEYCHNIWYGKNWNVWLLDSEKILKICLFVSKEYMNVTD